MDQHRSPKRIAQPYPLIHWISFIPAAVALGLIAAAEYRWGAQTSFSFFYLIPICFVAWFASRRLTLALCAAAMLLTLIVNVHAQTTHLKALWNSGARFAVLVCFALLVDQLRQHRAPDLPTLLRRMAAMIGVGFATLAILGVILWKQEGHLALGGSRSVRRAIPADESIPAATLLRRVAQDVARSMQLSRPILLGSRDPLGVSCVAPILTGSLADAPPSNHGDYNGGPGTTMAMVYCVDREGISSAQEDFEWHQTRLRTYLSNESFINSGALSAADQFSRNASQLADSIERWQVLPADFAPTPFTPGADWPSYCVNEMNAAISRKDLAGLKRWSAELRGAAFGLSDLHRWLGFLTTNHLAALDFQRKCESLFALSDARHEPYEINGTVSKFPAGVLSLNGLGNYYEIERQAERLYAVPADRLAALRDQSYVTPESIWVMPRLRKTYIDLRSVLSPAAQKVFDQAARTPYEHSFLTNMLYRASFSESAGPLSESLRRFSENYPEPTLPGIMGVMMYRGHPHAGLEWADRYRPELIAASKGLSGTDDQAMLSAARWTYAFGQPGTYGATLTLRDAILKRRLDCVRATDMIGAIYRDAGYARFANVRWCAETVGHATAAYLTSENGVPKTLLVDGMQPKDEMETWPSAFFHGHSWPDSLPGNPNPYAVELYVRGIDSYVFAEGYIVRGPNAGELSRAVIPYFPLRQTASTEKVFNGPYPDK